MLFILPAGRIYLKSAISSSPDGNYLTFDKVRNNQSDIFLKSVDGAVERNLTNDTWLDFGSIWSPDGREVAYISLRDNQYQVWSVQPEGGARRQLGVLAQRPRWLTSWSRQGTDIYYEAEGDLYLFSVTTGESRQLISLPSDEIVMVGFAVSLDEQWVAYRMKVANKFQLFVRPLAGGTPLQITNEMDSSGVAFWLPDGERLLFGSRRNGVWQICLAFRDGRAPVQITNGHENLRPWEITQDGHRIFYFIEHNTEANLHLIDVRSGTERQMTGALPTETFPSFAPDGERFVFQQANQNRNFYQQTLFTQTRGGTELKQLNDSGSAAQWSPSGDHIAFLRQQRDAYQLWVVRADGTQPNMVAPNLGLMGFAPNPYGWMASSIFSWTPDGQRLLYVSVKNGVSNLISCAVDGSEEKPLTDNTETTLKFYNPLLSANGQQLVFLGRQHSAGQVRYQIYFHDGLQTQLLWQTDEQVRLLGWSAAQTELYVAVIKSFRAVDPVKVKLMRISTRLASSEPRAVEVMQFEQAYWQTFSLSPTANQLAYVTRQDNVSNIWVVSLTDGQRRRLSANTEPAVNPGSLTWLPQANAIGFSKQSNTVSIWMIENFQ